MDSLRCVRRVHAGERSAHLGLCPANADGGQGHQRCVRDLLCDLDPISGIAPHHDHLRHRESWRCGHGFDFFRQRAGLSGGHRDHLRQAQAICRPSHAEAIIAANRWQALEPINICPIFVSCGDFQQLRQRGTPKSNHAAFTRLPETLPAIGRI